MKTIYAYVYGALFKKKKKLKKILYFNPKVTFRYFKHVKLISQGSPEKEN